MTSPNKSISIDKLAAALVKAQSELGGAAETETNPFLKNKYADLKSFIISAKPILAANELAVSQLAYNDGDWVGVTTILLHSSGQWMESSVSLMVGKEPGKSSAQVAGSIITYLRRQAYSGVLGMYANSEDTDGSSPAQKQVPSKPDDWSKHTALLEAIDTQVGYLTGNRDTVLKWLNQLTARGTIKLATDEKIIIDAMQAVAKKAADKKASAK